MAKIKEPPYESPYKIIEWKDSRGWTWYLEDTGDIEAQKKIKEAMPNQFFPESERTKAQMDKLYDRLSKAKTFDELRKHIFSAINWFTSPQFKTMTFTSLLEEKSILATTADEKKCIDLAIMSMKKHGAVPKKLKTIWSLLSNTGDSED